MTFLRRHLVLAVSLLLVVVCFGLYLFLVRPIIVRRQGVAKTIDEKLAQLRRYRDDPPSPEMVNRLSREKEMLESQYEEIVKALNFAEWVSLPEDTGDPLFLDEQIEKFERQIEKTEDELGRLAEKTGIIIPERLGFREERPEDLKELSILWNRLLLVRELVTLIIEMGASELFLLNPLPPGEEIVVLPPEREMPPGMEPPEREMPLGREELRFELGVRAEISALTNLLYQIANHSYFFTVQNLEIRLVRVRRERALPEVRERDRRRMQPPPPGAEPPLRVGPEEVEEELEVRLLVAAHLSLLDTIK